MRQYSLIPIVDDSKALTNPMIRKTLMKSIDSYRFFFPITSHFVFLNNAAVSPPSTRVLDVIRVLSSEFSHQGISCYGSWMKQVDTARSLFAQLIRASPNEIAFVPNTSEGLSIIASGLDWKSGDTVLVPLPDFPSNIYPWLNLEKLGVRISYYQRNNGRFGVKEVEKALHADTKLLTVSSVDFLTGFR
jgi:cysteine desulfurase/selenocysteine lyase